MKKVFSLIIALAMLLCCSCNESSSIFNAESNKNASKVNPAASIIEFDANNAVFYISSGESKKSPFELADAKKAKIGRSDNFEIHCNEIPNQINVNISGVQLSLEYSKTTSFDDNLENVDFYNRAFDRYENDLYRVEYLHDTNILTEYSLKSKIGYALDYSLSSESVAKAEQFISEVMPNDWKTNYKLDDMSIKNGSSSGYTHIFRRYVYGYEARDRICINVSTEGDILDFNAQFRGYYDDIESRVTNETLDTAKQKLHDMIESKHLNALEYEGSPMLDISADGVLFMYQAIKYQSEDRLQHCDIVFLKIG